MVFCYVFVYGVAGEGLFSEVTGTTKSFPSCQYQESNLNFKGRSFESYPLDHTGVHCCFPEASAYRGGAD